MRVVLCFIESLEEDGVLYKMIQDFDLLGYEVHLFTECIKNRTLPHEVLYELDNIRQEQDSNKEYLFFSSCTILFKLVYRLYHQTFDGFICVTDGMEHTCSYGETYDTLYQLNELPVEELWKPIYTNKDIHELNSREYSITQLLEKPCEVGKKRNTVKKYYKINQQYYLFEPVFGEKEDILYFGEGHDIPYDRINYVYFYDSDAIEQIRTIVLGDLNTKTGEMIIKVMEKLEKSINTKSHECNIIAGILEDFIRFCSHKMIHWQGALITYLIHLTKCPNYLEQLLDFTLTSPALTVDNQYFLWNQAKRITLSYDIMNSGIKRKQDELYDVIFKKQEQKFAHFLSPIPLEERNHNLIVIFTIQVLSERHAPTRTTLERCYTLGKEMGKDIILINTREQLTNLGWVLTYKCMQGNVIADNNDKSTYDYKDYSFPFYQPKEKMPSSVEILKLLQLIREKKPQFILSIGTGSIVADLCGRIVPQAALSVAFSNLPTTKGIFSLVGRRLMTQEWERLLKSGYQRDNIIESTFTFELNPQKRIVTRRELQIPEDKFILVVVGIRLDTEISDDFINAISDTFSLGTHIVFAGMFSRYEEFCAKYSLLKANSTFIGYYDDMLALMECCDLYVNPRRLGGGFSVVEAFSKGVPGVTICEGDVATAAGEEFCVDNYQDMIATIEKYMCNKIYYDEMADSAIKRSKYLTNSSLAMQEIVKKIENNRLFF